MEAGLPSWAALRASLVDALERKATTLEPKDQSKLNAAASHARLETDLWVAFDMLRHNLGVTSFRDHVRDAMKTAQTVAVPQSYALLAHLRIRGVLNLNIDRLATRALNAEHPGKLLVEHNGPTIARLQQVLTEPSRFVGNLHGIIEDSESWIFTSPQLSALLNNGAYKQFIQTVLATHTVIFLGITADDMAVGAPLAVLSTLGVETPTHFWLTDRTDATTDSWGENVGIRVIRYRSAGSDHSEVNEFLSDLLKATPPEQPIAPPVALERDAGVEQELPPPSEMTSWSAEQIRDALNKAVSKLLAHDLKDSFSEYEALRQRYDQAIYRAWYVTPDEGSNELLGYTLDREVAKGAFGRVYHATSRSGEQVAIKVLLENIRNDSRMLYSFRRGVRSMRILSDRDVDGMVAYKEASEIPAFVVMEWIEGPNLAEAKESGFIQEWHTVLRIGAEITRIIRRAHALPERVLHRDIRPSNVMLKDYFADSARAKVVVLDFDLSWHRNAYEVSVLHSASAGYLAPEQPRTTPGSSTRNAAVDSFGLGMTCLFLCSGEDPLPDQHRHVEWVNTVAQACSSIPAAEWMSAPARFSRVIVAATQDSQSARWDIAEIETELERLYDAVTNPGGVVAPDLIAEELAARTDVMQGYTWNADTLAAELQVPTGLSYILRADLQNERVLFLAQWAATGREERKSLEKYIATGAKTAVARLRAAGWQKVGNQGEGAATVVTAEMPAERLKGRIEDVASRIDSAMEKLRFGR